MRATWLGGGGGGGLSLGRSGLQRAGGRAVAWAEGCSLFFRPFDTSKSQATLQPIMGELTTLYTIPDIYRQYTTRNNPNRRPSDLRLAQQNLHPITHQLAYPSHLAHHQLGRAGGIMRDGRDECC